MCFITKGSVLKRAEKDIVCYKIMAEEIWKSDGRVAFFKSYYQDFEYEPGVIYRGKFELNMRFCHWLKLNISKGGYHSYIYKCRSWELNSVTVKCIIPKGSLYLENRIDGQYCSTAIKVVEII